MVSECKIKGNILKNGVVAVKYIFLTVLHRMKLNRRLNKGIQIYPGVRISNGKEAIAE